MTMALAPLPAVMIGPIVRSALLEDLGRAGDITTNAVVSQDEKAAMCIAARQPGVVAGLDLVALAFRLTEPRVDFSIIKPDGSRVEPGDVIALIEGPAAGLLTALNLLCRPSGILTATASLVSTVADHKARLLAPARRRPACGPWRNMPCEPAVAPIIASVGTTPS